MEKITLENETFVQSCLLKKANSPSIKYAKLHRPSPRTHPAEGDYKFTLGLRVAAHTIISHVRLLGEIQRIRTRDRM